LIDHFLQASSIKVAYEGVFSFLEKLSARKIVSSKKIKHPIIFDDQSFNAKSPTVMSFNVWDLELVNFNLKDLKSIKL
jgi:hypothetical protein